MKTRSARNIAVLLGAAAPVAVAAVALAGALSATRPASPVHLAVGHCNIAVHDAAFNAPKYPDCASD